MSEMITVIIIILIVIEIILTLYKFFNNLYLGKKQKNDTKFLKNLSSICEDISISVHIPTRAEPFEVVKKCIDAILPQLTSKDEIFIIDNNHTNEAHYKPLEAYCKAVGVLFQHHDYIPGFKAGALNIALENTSEEVTHVLIVDCDYVLEPNALQTLRHASYKTQRFGFLQFPQAYINNDKIDIENELNKYFLYNLKINSTKSLGTGTLCFIPKNNLLQIGGWPIKSITEDALFGLKIQTLAKTGLYEHQIIGRGFLPKTLKDFLNQRRRWIYGNAEVLIGLLNHAEFKWLTAGNFSQLSAWLNFAAITLTLHVLLLCFRFSGYNVELPMYFVYAHYMLLFLTKLYEFFQLPIPFWQKIRACLVQWQFLCIAAFHWLPVLLKQSKEFIRTPKINKFHISLWHLPVLFLILQLATIWAFSNNYILVLLSAWFVLIEIISKIVLVSNFKK